MTDLGRVSPGSPRTGYKRERDFKERRSPARNRLTGSSPRRYDPDRSPPRKKRRDDYDRKDTFDRRKDSPHRSRDYDRGRHSDSPRHDRGFGGRDLQRYDGPLQHFNQFFENQEDRPPLSVAQRRYEDYKLEFDRRNSRRFFKQHQEDAWFRERYYPPLLIERFKEEAVVAQKAAELFLEDLKNGNLPIPNWDAEDPKATQEQVILEPKTDLPPEKTEISEKNGQKASPSPPKEDDVTMEDAGNKENNSEKISETRSPDHLADSSKETDPEGKTLLEETKGDDITSSGKSEKEEDRKNDTEDKKEKRDPVVLKPRKNPNLLEPPADLKTLFIPTIPTSCSVTGLLSALNKVDSGKVDRLLISDPKPTKNCLRVGWVTYSTEATAKEALDKIKGTKILDDFEIDLILHVPRYEQHPARVTPVIASTPSRIQRDLELIRHLTKVFDDSQGITKNILLGRISTLPKEPAKTEKKEDQEVHSSNCTDNHLEENRDIALINLEDRILEHSSEKEQLDLFISYLSRVHNHCYYSCRTYASPIHLQIQGGGIVRRGSKINCSDEDPDSWTSDLDKKIKEKLSKQPSLQKEATGQMAAEKGVENLYRDKISKESEDRFRCELCHKMFKAVRFVQKHIDTKHPDIVNAIKEKALDTQFYTNYITDPGRILPSMQYKSKKEHRAAKSGSSHDKLLRGVGDDKSGRQGWTWSPRTTDLQSPHGDKRSPRGRLSRSPRNKSPRGRSSRSPRDRSPRSPRDRSPRSPRSPRDRSPRSPRSPRDRPSRSPRTRSPLGRSPRRSPRGRSPLRYRSPRGRSPRSRSPWGGGRSPWTRSPRNKSPWGPRSPLGKSTRRSSRGRGSWDRSPRDRSPRDRSFRDRSPRDKSLRGLRSPRQSPSWMAPRDRPPRDRSPWGGRSPRDRSPRDRSPLDRSPRDRSRERRLSGRGSWSRRYGSGARPRIEYVGRQAIPTIEFKDKLDPRSPILYVDLDRPPEDSFEIDYEKALAAFAAGAK